MSSDIKPEIKELSAKIAKAITFDENGVATIDKGFYESILPENIKVEDIKAIKEFDTKVVAAACLGFGEKAIDVMAKNNGIERSEFSLPTIGRDSFDFVIKGKVDGINPGTKEPIISYGQVRVSGHVESVNNAGQLKKVKTSLAELAMASLGKK